MVMRGGLCSAVKEVGEVSYSSMVLAPTGSRVVSSVVVGRPVPYSDSRDSGILYLLY